MLSEYQGLWNYPEPLVRGVLNCARADWDSSSNQNKKSMNEGGGIMKERESLWRPPNGH